MELWQLPNYIGYRDICTHSETLAKSGHDGLITEEHDMKRARVDNGEHNGSGNSNGSVMEQSAATNDLSRNRSLEAPGASIEQIVSVASSSQQ